ncbi:hypothetical protein H7K24_20140 [Mycobacterium fragae]|nr:hypothetical protein [Mycobacterium fragae]
MEPDADHVGEQAADEQTTESYQVAPREAEPKTEVISQSEREQEAAKPRRPRGERRFTAPGFDAKETAVIKTTAEPVTEAFEKREAPSGSSETRPKTAVPQLIPPRLGAKLRPSSQHSWGWVLALILIILALAAVAVLGTVLLTRSKKPKASSEDQVRTTIQSYDIAVQRGDLATLRRITCGDVRDGYVNYDERAWTDTYRRVTAAKQYPVVASIDQVVVNDGHAEANVTAFMAYAPQIRSTRSFDLQYRDDEWKICQSRTG